MKIVIVRHGKPVPIHNEKIPAHRLVEWINDYNDAGLSQDSRPSHECLQVVQQCKLIVSSTLKRSIESASALIDGRMVLSDNVFVEAGLPYANWNILKMSPKFWAVIFRIMWLFGYSRNSESYKEAKNRAALASDKLIELASSYDGVMLVGHGVFNRLIAKELSRRGFLSSAYPSSQFWGMIKLTK